MPCLDESRYCAVPPKIFNLSVMTTANYCRPFVVRFISSSLGFLACVGFGAMPVSAAEGTPNSLKTYFLGNSLTGQTTLKRLDQLFQSQGVDFTFGSQIAAGATLDFHYNQRNTNFGTRPFGLYTTAFSNYTWDSIVLHPFGRALRDTQCCRGSIDSVQDFLNYYEANNPSPNANFYLYSSWMYRDEIKENKLLDKENPARYAPLNYQARWDEPYVVPKYGPGNTTTRDFYYRLLEITRANNPNLSNRLRLIPIGDVLYELDRRIKAGLIPGLTSPNGVEQLYADRIHFSSTRSWPPQPSIGTYVVGLTFYATLSQSSPIGLSGSLWNLDDVEDAGLIRALQRTVWDVVNGHPYSGVSVFAGNPNTLTPVAPAPRSSAVSLPLLTSPAPTSPAFGTTATPEPLTLLGASTAIAFGAAMKKRQRQRRDI